MIITGDKSDTAEPEMNTKQLAERVDEEKISWQW
jgi:hypothetical protein